jgi:hypothetical protein
MLDQPTNQSLPFLHICRLVFMNWAFPPIKPTFSLRSFPSIFFNFLLVVLGLEYSFSKNTLKWGGVNIPILVRQTFRDVFRFIPVYSRFFQDLFRIFRDLFKEVMWAHLIFKKKNMVSSISSTSKRHGFHCN